MHLLRAYLRLLQVSYQFPSFFLRPSFLTFIIKRFLNQNTCQFQRHQLFSKKIMLLETLRLYITKQMLNTILILYYYYFLFHKFLSFTIYLLKIHLSQYFVSILNCLVFCNIGGFLVMDYNNKNIAVCLSSPL